MKRLHKLKKAARNVNGPQDECDDSPVLYQREGA